MIAAITTTKLIEKNLFLIFSQQNDDDFMLLNLMFTKIVRN